MTAGAGELSVSGVCGVTTRAACALRRRGRGVLALTSCSRTCGAGGSSGGRQERKESWRGSGSNGFTGGNATALDFSGVLPALPALLRRVAGALSAGLRVGVGAAPRLLTRSASARRLPGNSTIPASGDGCDACCAPGVAAASPSSICSRGVVSSLISRNGVHDARCAVDPGRFGRGGFPGAFRPNTRLLAAGAQRPHGSSTLGAIYRALVSPVLVAAPWPTKTSSSAPPK